MTRPKDIIIFGAGGQGREVLQLISQINATKLEWNCLGWIDDGVEAGTVVAGLPVLGGLEVLNRWPKPVAVAMAIAWPSTKAKIVHQLSAHQLSFPSLIHPEVLLEKDEVRLGKGTIITQGCRFTVNIDIGDFVLLNIGTVVTHDVQVANFCSVMPSVNLSGAVHLEQQVYVGTGTQIIQGLNIGTGTIIGAGSVVISDLPAHCTAVGVPARVVKHRSGGDQ